MVIIKVCEGLLTKLDCLFACHVVKVCPMFSHENKESGNCFSLCNVKSRIKTYRLRQDALFYAVYMAQ